MTILSFTHPMERKSSGAKRNTAPLKEMSGTTNTALNGKVQSSPKLFN